MIQTINRNNARVYYDDRFNVRWLDVIGDLVHKYIMPTGLAKDDTTNDPDRWANDETGANTILSSTVPGERLVVTTGATEYNGVNLQLHGSDFQLTTNHYVYFGIRCKTDNATKGDFLFGLCEVDTALLAEATAHALAVTDDGIYFSKLNDGTSFNFTNELGGTEGTTSTAVTNDTSFHTYELYFDGTTLYVYVDDSLITSIATGLADQALTPSINVRAGDDGAEVLDIDWLRAFQIRI